MQMKRTVPSDVVINEDSIRLFQKEINKCEVSLMESKKHLTKVLTQKLIAKREGNQIQLEKLELHEKNAQLVLTNTANTLGRYRSELNIAMVANMIGHPSNDLPEFSDESIINMQHSLNRLKSRRNNSDTLFG